jgi:ubiquinone/menaquinone biosynthesis C-methylase UbiE
MRVLEVGCGAVDVFLLVTSPVGPEGAEVGTDTFFEASIVPDVGRWLTKRALP